MSRKLSAANHSRHVDILLRRWLEERRRLLSLYCSLSRALRDGSVQPATTQKLDRFCEILVDYVSAGHFEVYCELFDEGMRSHNGQHGDVACNCSSRVADNDGIRCCVGRLNIVDRVIAECGSQNVYTILVPLIGHRE